MYNEQWKAIPGYEGAYEVFRNNQVRENELDYM